MRNRIFTFQDQLAFAEFSGDYNPLHIDNVAARRLLYGAVVVHGIHSLLWGLDSWLKDRVDYFRIYSIQIRFRKPINLYENVRLLDSTYKNGNHVVITLLIDEEVVTVIDMAWDTKQLSPHYEFRNRFPQPLHPSSLLKHQLEGRSGNIDLDLNINAGHRYFPNLFRCVSPIQIATLLNSSRLVGAECPGLNSIYSEINLTVDESDDCNTLKYQVTKFDPRFQMVNMNVVAPSMRGVIKAFVRPPPQEQDSLETLSRLVRGNEFSNQRALIVGGSRGLGEVTAKILAAGGAEVSITYHQGANDAQQIVEEIVSNGGIAQHLKFDVLSDKDRHFDNTLNHLRPTHLYYFPTPRIFTAVAGVFSPTLFTRFCNYYVEGFLNTLKCLVNNGMTNVFYPSSVAVDEPTSNMSEYVAAKLAGETVCKFVQKHNSSIRVYCPRLPRMSTDQTVTLLPYESQNPGPIMLEHFRSQLP